MYSNRVSSRSKHTRDKAFETTDAINNGADEVDMVINIGALKSKDDQQVQKISKQLLKQQKIVRLSKLLLKHRY